MIHRNKNLHFSALNPSAPTLHINRNQAATQLETLGYSCGDAVYVGAFLNSCTDADTRRVQLTSATGEVL